MDDFKLPVTPIFDGNSFAIDGDVISTTGSGGFPPDTDKGLDVEDNRLVAKVDDETIKFDSNGKIKVGESVVEWKEYPAETLVNEKLILPSNSPNVIKIGSTYYAPNAAGTYIASCVDNYGLNWNNTPVLISTQSINGRGIYKVTLEDGNDYLLGEYYRMYTGLTPNIRFITMSVGKFGIDGTLTNVGYLHFVYSSSYGTTSYPYNYLCNIDTDRLLLYGQLENTATNPSGWMECYNIKAANITTDFNAAMPTGVKRSGEFGVGQLTSRTPIKYLCNAFGFAIFSHPVANSTVTDGKAIYTVNVSTGFSSTRRLIAPSANCSGVSYNNKLYLFSNVSSSTMRVVSSDWSYVDEVMPYTGIVKAAYGDVDNFYLCYSDGQIWRYNGTTWDKLHGTDSATVFSKVGVFDDGEIYGINTTTKKLWTLGTAKVHRIEQNNIDVTTDFITWLRWELQKNIY